MPLFAINSNSQLINARNASRHHDYHCLECQQMVRLRGGPHRRPHFYHPDTSHYCRQNQKGAIHLYHQHYLLNQFPQNDGVIELPFPSICRIADVAWLSKRILFEIQCSPISSEEVIARNRDYHSLGWSVVWILHDRRYNQFRLSGAEMALLSLPHFFSNMDHQGSGMIYDQFDICEGRLRHCRLPPLPVQLNEIVSIPTKEYLKFPFDQIKERVLQWQCAFKGDLLDQFFNHPNSPYLKQAEKKIKEFYPQLSLDVKLGFLKVWQKFIATPYRQFFRYFLEKMCR